MSPLVAHHTHRVGVFPVHVHLINHAPGSLVHHVMSEPDRLPDEHLIPQPEHNFLLHQHRALALHDNIERVPMVPLLEDHLLRLHLLLLHALHQAGDLPVVQIFEKT